MTTIPRQSVKVACQTFRKNPDGSWDSVLASDINTPDGAAIRLPPGMTFKKGITFSGIDVAALLDQNCAQ